MDRGSGIQIVDYHEEYKDDFKKLNEEWISKYFNIEAEDLKALEHPKEYIIDKGGAILLALRKNKVIGVCALIKLNNKKQDFELAKMAVSTQERGRGIGYELGIAIIDKAKSMGAHSLYLESNTQLKPALSLYKKLGFKELEFQHTAYERCNIQMELEI